MLEALTPVLGETYRASKVTEVRLRYHELFITWREAPSAGMPAGTHTVSVPIDLKAGS